MEKQFERGDRMLYLFLVILGFAFGVLAAHLDHKEKTAAGVLSVFMFDNEDPILGLHILPEYAANIDKMDRIVLTIEREHGTLE